MYDVAHLIQLLFFFAKRTSFTHTYTHTHTHTNTKHQTPNAKPVLFVHLHVLCTCKQRIFSPIVSYTYTSGVDAPFAVRCVVR